MALSPEQEWILVAAGLVAHADDVLEVGEWEHVIRLCDERLSVEETAHWMDLLVDRSRLEAHFAAMSPPAPVFSAEILERSWQMALSDGAGSEVEALVHDRIAERLGVDGDEVAAWRREWTAKASRRAELVVGFAAVLANLDGRMDSAEAVQFESLLEKMPVSIGRRLELQAKLHEPPTLEDLSTSLMALDEPQRREVLRELAPLVHASARGEREREVFLQLADRIALTPAEAERLLS
jgi:uncharacterized tellurite resistance protein B-like protein